MCLIFKAAVFLVQKSRNMLSVRLGGSSAVLYLCALQSLLVSECLGIQDDGGTGPEICLESARTVEVRSNSVTLGWTHSCSPGQLLDIRWREDSQEDWASGREVDSSDNAANIPDLEIGTIYVFQLAQISTLGHRGFQTVRVETKTQDRATNIVLTPGNLTGTLRIEWNPAMDATVLGQTISLRSDGTPNSEWGYNLVSDQSPILPPNQSNAVVDNLLPYTLYRVQINTLFSDERATTLSLNLAPQRTAAGIPDMVQNLRPLNGTSTSLSITWDALVGRAAGGEGLAVQYIIEVAGESESFPDANPFVLPAGRGPQLNLASLPKASVVRFRASARNSAGLQSAPSSILALTTEASLPHPPSSAPVVTISGGVLRVQWSEVVGNAATGGVDVDGYTVYRKREVGGVFTQVGAVGAGESTMFEVPEGVLELGVPVVFAVSAVNSVGEGERSLPSHTVVPPTAPSMPSVAVETVEASVEDGATIRVSWNASALPAGYALGYLVRMREGGESAAFDVGQEVPSRSGVQDYLFRNLSLGSVFGFMVCPSVAVEGAPSTCSDTASIETPGALVPTTVTTAMRLFGGGGVTIVVSWVPPLASSRVASYNIFQLLAGGTEISVHEAAGGVSSSEVIGVLGSTYTHRVQAVLVDGERSVPSTPSLPLLVPPTLPTIMSKPLLALDAACNTCILASWTPLTAAEETGGSPILEYEILYTDGVVERSTSTIVGNRSAEDVGSLVVTGLQRGDIFRARVVPINAQGSGPISTYSEGLTLPVTAPDQPQNLRFAAPAPSADQVTLEWDVPASGNEGDITGYRLFTFYYLDDQDTGTLLPAGISGAVNQYTVTGLGGGVDYRFRISAFNSNNLESTRSDPLDHLTVPVVPLALSSLTIAPNSGDAADLGTRYELLLSWTISEDLVSTGGEYITGYSLQYAVDASTVFDANTATWCTNNTGISPCDSDSIGVPSKGDGFVGLVSQIIFEAIKGTKYRSMDITWDYDPTCVRCYTTKEVNGGRTITNIQVDISDAGAPWKLLGTDMPQAAGFGAITQRDSSYNAKEIQLLIFTLQENTMYSFRMRASNDNGTTWSEYSPSVNATTLQAQAFSNVRAYQADPPSTVMRVEWFEPYETLPSNLQSDSVRIYYGTSASRINRLATLDGLTLVPQDLSYANVLGLIPLTTYYFTVMGFDTALNDQKNATISEASFPADTAASPPITPGAPNVTSPQDRAMQMHGDMLVSWTIPPEGCSTGPLLADGSVSGCPRGQRGVLSAWRLYARRSEVASYGAAWFSVDGTESSGVAEALDKGARYCFALQAVNSQAESQLSNETCTIVTITPPAAPPTPTMRSASSSAVRISVNAPADLGSIYAQTRQIRVDITPSSSPDAWISRFLTWGTSLILTDLQPSAELLFRTAAQNDILSEFSEPSGILYGRTTPLPPSNVRLGTGQLLSSLVPVEWDEVREGVGNATVAGYRVSWVAEETGESGQQTCNANAKLLGCSIHDLPMTGNYSFTVAATTDPLLQSNFGAESAASLLSTSPSAPSLTTPVVSDITWESAVVTWDSSSGGKPIISQSIQALPDRDTPLPPVALEPAPSRFELLNLGPNLIYTVLVTAVNSIGQSLPKASAPFLTLPAPVPAPEFTAASSSSVTVRWEAWSGLRSLLRYRLQVRTTDADGTYEERRRAIQELVEWRDVGEVEAPTTEMEIRGLQPQTLVEVRVAASNENGWGPWGPPGRGDTVAGAPEIVHVSTVQDTIVTLQWVPPDGAGALYSILPEQWDGASWLTLAPQTARATSISPLEASGNATGLDKGTTFRFFVAVSREGGSVGDYSPPSNPVTTLTSAPDPGPRPDAMSSTATSIRLEWPTARITEAEFTGGSIVTQVVLQAKQEAEAEWSPERFVSRAAVVAAGGGGSSSAYDFDGLESSRYYQFRIRLNNAIGNGTYGAPSVSRLTLPGQMPPPVLLAGTSTIVATWAAVADPTFQAFEVGISEYTGADNVWLDFSYRLGGSGETSAAFSELQEDWQYRFTLAVRNDAGWGARSEIALSRTTLEAPALLPAPNDITSVIDTEATLHWEPTLPENRRSTLGWRIYACRKDLRSADCVAEAEQLSLCFPDFPQATAHSCDNTISSYTRTGLRKNTPYTFRLALVNPGGAGPQGPESSSFTTKSTFPVQMSAPTATVIDDTRIRVTWSPVTEWNARGGLDMIAYHVFARTSGGVYPETPVTVYPLDVFDSSQTVHVFEDLPPNTVYFFAVIGENTACTLIFQSILPACCDTFSCSPKSVESDPVATLLAPMPAPRLGAATQTAIRVDWDQPAGTTGNLAEVLLEYQDLDRPSKDSIDTWISEYLPGTSTQYWIQGLRVNNRYNVRLRGKDQAGRWGAYGPTSVVISKPEPVAAIEITSVEATVVALAWGLPLGRKDNILGYNITAFRHLADGGQVQSSQTVEGSVTEATVTGLERASLYSFRVDPYSEAGLAGTVTETEIVTTQLEDAEASCRLYPTEAASATGGELALVRAGATLKVSGAVSEVVPALLRMEVQLFGRSGGTNASVALADLDASLSLAEQLEGRAVDPSYRVTRAYSTSLPYASLALTGDSSAVGATLVVATAAAPSSPVARCELGIARPPSANILNSAFPSSTFASHFGWCRLISFSDAHPQLQGRLLFSPAEGEGGGTRVRARVCGLQAQARYPLRLHQYGDVRSLPFSAGGISFDLGDVEIDNLGSGQYDAEHPSLTMTEEDAEANRVSLVGRSFLLYATADGPARADAPLAACVAGFLDDVEEQLDALSAPCEPCTHLLQHQDSLHSVAELYEVDWVTVWSLNPGLMHPDKGAQPGLSIYYAHPMRLLDGETAASVFERFAISEEQGERLNPGRSLDELSAGDIVCVAPVWRSVVDRMGEPLCNMRFASLQEGEENQDRPQENRSVLER